MRDRLGRGVVVLGMHRSGTSALTECLTVAGCDPGPAEALLPPAVDNPRGFFELRDLVAANDRLLAAAGARWDLPVHDPDELAHRRHDPVRRALVDLLRRHLPERGWVMKDPRLCVLWPLYEPVFSEPPLTVFMARAPSACVDSLHRRDLMDVGQANDLWLRYNTLALAAADRSPHVVCVRYEQLLQDPARELTRIADAATSAGIDLHVGPEVLDVIDVGLRRSATADEDPETPSGALWAEIVRRCDGQAPRPVVASGLSPRTTRIAASYRSLVREEDPPRPPAPDTASDPVAELGADLSPVVDRSPMERWVDQLEAGHTVGVVRGPGWLWTEIATALRLQEGWHATVAIAADEAWPDEDRADAAERLIDGLRSAAEGAAGTLLDFYSDLLSPWTSGLVPDALDCLRTAGDLGLELALTLRRDASVAPGSEQRWAGLALSTMLPAIAEPRGWVDATAIDRSVVDGSFARLLAVLRSTPTVLVGPPHLAPIASAWEIPGLVHVPVADAGSRSARREALELFSALLRSWRGAPPVVIVASDPVGPTLVRAARQTIADVSVIDIGSVPEVWLEPWWRAHQWVSGRVELQSGV